MSNQTKRTKEEIRKAIRDTSREEFILSEMKRTGFWPTDSEVPTVSEKIVDRRNELQKELRELVAKERKIKDPDKLLKDYRKQRMKESREKQKANREKRAQERKDKAAAWEERKSKEILYLGENISGGLQEKASDAAKLTGFGLTDFGEAAGLAKAMGITVGQLSFLSFNRRVSKVSHYRRFYMKKKSGGKRLISAPMPKLKQAQYWILENILNKIPVHPLAHGFANEKSIVTNAQPHVQQDVVINLDFKDFFPTITFRRVKGVFCNLGYSEHLATILAAICTEPDVDMMKMDGTRYFVAKGERVLPQGAPTSPALTNILCYKMDKRLEGTAKSLNFNYTRYADDLTFSASGDSVKDIYKLLWRVKSITTHEGFVLHPDKLRIMRNGAKQEVTGIVVNNQLGIDRRTMRKFRALLHQIKTTGWKGKKWGASNNIKASVWGYANFVFMVKPEKGKALFEEVKQLMGEKSIPVTKSNSSSLERKIKEAQQEIVKEQKDKGDKTPWKLW